jgi:hypothetical protein
MRSGAHLISARRHERDFAGSVINLSLPPPFPGFLDPKDRPRIGEGPHRLSPDMTAQSAKPMLIPLIGMQRWHFEAACGMRCEAACRMTMFLFYCHYYTVLAANVFRIDRPYFANGVPHARGGKKAKRIPLEMTRQAVGTEFPPVGTKFRQRFLSSGRERP